MTTFRKLDIITGWVVFAIASLTYLLTIEPTASLWDCGEFITSANKLEVGHPPGAPLFALMGRIFAMFAPTAQIVPILLNSMSALASGFTILFLFWSITHMARKYFGKKPEEMLTGEIYATLGCGIIGALAYTFSDTFWFSAVEGEVYATSSLFTAVVFWAALKWEEAADTKYSNRWLVLIAYLTGLSIGVHLLNLLAIPAIGMIYYFRKAKKVTTKGLFIALAISAVILLGVLYGIIPGIPRLAAYFDLMFVNSFGLFVNSGTLFTVFLIAAVLAFLINYTYKKGKVIANTVFLCIAMISLGYSSYAMIIIRASANTPMDQNDPDNIFALLSYLNRDQYGDRPLFKGQYYDTPITNYDIKDLYVECNGKYEKADEKISYVYDDNRTTLFPRMYSNSDDNHIKAYCYWGGMQPKKGRNGQVLADGKGDIQYEEPTFWNNLRFFFGYQMGWMYWRYFMWNFCGRQNDYAGYAGILYGNWITGINFLDEARLGSQENLPQFLAENKGRNTYYGLPLLLGLLGVVMHAFSKNCRRDFSVVLMLFFMTGIAIIIYLNQTPYQPRERDYAYAGSFYAFAIWIGLGVLGIYELFRKFLEKRLAATTATVVSLLCVPIIMAAENWDDHDRSGRYITVDFGTNYLESCAPNSVVFTYGDNDTFSLWYSQEVENKRTDVRVANISYIYSDWYYEQMMRAAYESKGFKFSATPEKVLGSRRNMVAVNNKNDKTYELKDVMNFIMNDDSRAKVSIPYSRNPVNFFPSPKIKITVDPKVFTEAKAIGDSVLVPNTNAANSQSQSIYGDTLLNQIDITLTKNHYVKNQIAIFDIVANNFGERPIYLGFTAPSEYVEPFKGHLKTVGMAWLITPEKITMKNSVDLDRDYNLYMNVYKFRGLNDPKIYWDETAKRLTGTYRMGFRQLLNALIVNGDTVRAENVLNRYVDVLPVFEKDYDNAVDIIRYRYTLGDTDKAKELSSTMLERMNRDLSYYEKLPESKRNDLDVLGETYHDMISLQNLFKIAALVKDKELQTEIENLTKNHESIFRNFQ